MDKLGIATELQESLLNPRFAHMFKCQSLLYWLRDTMRMRFHTVFEGLYNLENNISRTTAIPERSMGGKTRGRGEGPIALGESSSSYQQEDAPTIVISRLTTVDEDCLPSAWLSIGKEPPIRKGFVALYKAASLAKMMKGSCLIKDDGTLNMSAIRSSLEHDFNYRSNAWYWTEERKTTEEYRQWIALQIQDIRNMADPSLSPSEISCKSPAGNLTLLRSLERVCMVL
jgi:hypothetical protein